MDNEDFGQLILDHFGRADTWVVYGITSFLHKNSFRVAEALEALEEADSDRALEILRNVIDENNTVAGYLIEAWAEGDSVQGMEKH